MSDHLKEFLSAWLDWVDAGAPGNDVFERFCGLCSNFRWYMRAHDASEDVVSAENQLLKELFKSEGLDEGYPFGGIDAYNAETSDDTAHLNDARIRWVRSKVASDEAADDMDLIMAYEAPQDE